MRTCFASSPEGKAGDVAYGQGEQDVERAVASERDADGPHSHAVDVHRLDRRLVASKRLGRRGTPAELL